LKQLITDIILFIKEVKNLFDKDMVYGGVIIVLVALLVVSVLTQGFGIISKSDATDQPDTNGNATVTPSSNSATNEKPVVQLYTMSYCPYGNIAEEAIKPAIELLGDKIQFEPRYVIYADYGGEDYCIENGAYCSMHGVQELNQNIREQCVWKNDKGKFWAFVFAMNKQCDYKNADTCWESVAQGLGIDTSAIKQCEASSASIFAAADYALNQKYGIRGSPALVVDGKSVQPTSRTPEAYKQVICAAFDTAPQECNTVLSGTGVTATGGCG
jgi:hypothetical protein